MRIRIITLLFCVFLVSGCATLEDADERYPDKLIVGTQSLVGKWHSRDSTLELRENGEFSSEDLNAEYFQCSSEEFAGVHRKTGGGKWSSRESEETSAIFLTFEDDCAATLWVGEREGEVVLWGSVEIDGRIMTLHTG
jgi:hypothetical protein